MAGKLLAMCSVLCGLWLAAPAGAQEPSGPAGPQEVSRPPAGDQPELTDPLDILQRASKAAMGLKSVKYSLSNEVIGGAKTLVPQIQATVCEAGSGEPEQPVRTRIDVKAVLAGVERNQTASYDGQNFCVADHLTRKLHVGEDGHTLGSLGRLANVIMMHEFLDPSAFAMEMDSDNRELLAAQRVGDEDCYQIHAVFSGGLGEVTWLISKKDFLPRRRHDKFKTADGEEGQVIKTVSQLQVNPALDEATFKLQLPEGYEKVDQAAP